MYEDDDMISDLGTKFYYSLLIIEYIWMYLIAVPMIYIILGREFIRPRANFRRKGKKTNSDASNTDTNNK